MRKTIFTLAAGLLAAGGIAFAATPAQAAATHPAAAQNDCGSGLFLFLNGYGYMAETGTNVITANDGGQDLCLIGSSGYPNQLQIANTNTCIYASKNGVGGATNDNLYTNTCNSNRAADFWVKWASGCLSNDLYGYDGGTGYCASGYPSGNIVNMYPWNFTSAEIWSTISE